MNTSEQDWIEFNQRYLMAALADVRAALQQHDAAEPGPANAGSSRPSSASSQDVPEGLPGPSALDMLTAAFGLSSFERSILLLCAGMDLDSSFATICAAAHGDSSRSYPTFSLALATLRDPHWSAIGPAAPLRKWRLIEICNQAGGSLTTSPLRIDERVLHFLAGIQHLDERLVAMLEPMHPTESLVPSEAGVARKIAGFWSRGENPLPVIYIYGADGSGRRSVASVGAAHLGLHLYAVPAETIPANPGEMEGFARLWEREAALTSSALYLDAGAIDQTDLKAVAPVARLLERIQGPVLLGSDERWRPLRRPLRYLEVGKPTSQEQQAAWQLLLEQNQASINGGVKYLVAQFNLSIPAIHASVEEALESVSDGKALATALWDAGRSQARPRLDDMAQRLEPVAKWDDLVVPANEKSLLLEIAAHVRHRATVYDAWGFGAVCRRGLGISSLFSGSSGTGKTMAAEVLANELRLDLYRIDLSSVVSKYIGETEKNLRRVFDAAEDGGAILFFDEADALFGKRSEIKDSHDRYANIEINYLLQRMESYRGLAVLATNMKSALDAAFLRRIRFVVNFPFPEFGQRAEIWQRVFPPDTPIDGLRVDQLARLNIAGGSIRNIALNAAFLAADAGEPVRMAHILRSARTEYAKLEKPLTEMETATWQ
jgi:hypothetical protein